MIKLSQGEFLPIEKHWAPTLAAIIETVLLATPADVSAKNALDTVEQMKSPQAYWGTWKILRAEHRGFIIVDKQKGNEKSDAVLILFGYFRGILAWHYLVRKRV
jgi:hypothetical protein